MNSFLLVDTDILIDIARNNPAAISRLKLEENRASLQISSITQMELIVGCRNKKEIKALYSFLNRFALLRISETISDKATELLTRYRLSHGLLIPDAIIAATAIISGIQFMTKNRKDFQYIKELNLANYP